MHISAREFRSSFFHDYFILRKSLSRCRNENAASYPNVACFAFDSITAEIIVFGRFEKNLLDVIFSGLDRFSTVFKETTAVDVGANIGNHSLYFAERFARVCAIEASPKTFELLCFNARHSGYSNITPINAAVGETKGKFLFAEHRHEAGRSGIMDPSSKMVEVLRAQPGRIYEVDVDSGDSVLSQSGMPPVSLIKIDVEGFEVSVIKNLRSTIENFHPFILIEQIAHEVRSGASDTLDLLRQYGYEFYAPESAGANIGNRYLRLLSRFLHGDTIELQPLTALSPRHYPMILCCAGSSLLSLNRSV